MSRKNHFSASFKSFVSFLYTLDVLYNSRALIIMILLFLNCNNTRCRKMCKTLTNDFFKQNIARIIKKQNAMHALFLLRFN